MKTGTFSYLPPLGAAQVRKQVEYIVARGWNAAIEHTDPQRMTGSYWTMWKLPMFGETDVERILAEAEACRSANPGHHVRVIGYDNLRQTLGAAFVVHHA
ncbi:MAG: ribulose bisphosphate carboxylase small subunit [Pseudomonadota bacterium]